MEDGGEEDLALQPVVDSRLLFTDSATLEKAREEELEETEEAREEDLFLRENEGVDSRLNESSELLSKHDCGVEFPGVETPGSETSLRTRFPPMNGL